MSSSDSVWPDSGSEAARALAPPARYLCRDGAEARGPDIFGLFRSETDIAAAHGAADAIDGVTRDRAPSTRHYRSYWDNYRRGRAAYLEAAERNAREGRAR